MWRSFGDAAAVCPEHRRGRDQADSRYERPVCAAIVPVRPTGE